MIFPNKLSYFKRTAHDQYGQEQFAAGVTEKCAIVKLTRSQQHTSVRADQTASRAHADEFVAAAVLLLVPNTRIKINDRVDIGGISLRTISLRQQYSVTGKLDHIQAEFELWA